MLKTNLSVHLHPLTTSEQPWSHIPVDFIIGLPPSEGKTVLLTIIDYFSKAVHIFALSKLQSALEAARPHGPPCFPISRYISTLCVISQFTSRVWRDEQVSLSSGFHPQTKGQVERASQEPEAALQCLASSNKATWSQPISWIKFAHNSLTSSPTGLSSF